eukprot:SAG31_NODE_19705_length_594_cov_0.573737_1_plen_23_part_10
MTRSRPTAVVLVAYAGANSAERS